MATISSAGIGSGLDVETIVTKLMSLERQPINQLQSTASTIQSKISTWGRIKSSMSSLNDASDVLAKASTWGARTVTSSDATSVSATVTGSGSTGNVTIKAQQLASSQSVATVGYSAKTDLVGEGTLSIDIGKWGASNTFTPNAAPSSTSITFSATDTLEDARNKINSANAGVSASIVNDGSSYRLVISSATSGEKNGFRITANDIDGNNTNSSGISRLAYDPANSTAGTTRTQTAADAVALVNNLEIRSSTNTFSEAVEGVSFTLNKVTGNDVSLNLNTDTDGIKKAIDSFVTAYNSLQGMIKTNTRYNPDNPKTGGVLQGDRTALDIQTQLRNTLGQAGPASALFSRLSDIGFNIATDGTLSIKADKLTQAMTKPAELQKLFAGDPASPSSLGLGKIIGNKLDDLLKTGGNVSTRTDGLSSTLKTNQDRQDRLENRMTMVEKRLRAQYTALDTSMASMNSLSSYVSQQVSSWNKG